MGVREHKDEKHLHKTIKTLSVEQRKEGKMIEDFNFITNPFIHPCVQLQFLHKLFGLCVKQKVLRQQSHLNPRS